jgi:TetR/AcrR family transcriptional regulator
MGKNEKLSLNNLLSESELYDNPLTEKQKDILTAAEKLFSEQGYSDTPTAQIAKSAGVTEKTLFKHFPTKADLLKRVMFPLLLRMIVPTQIKHLKDLIKGAGPHPEDVFKAILRDRLQFVAQHHGKIKFVLIELIKNGNLRKQVGKIWHDQLWTEMIQLIDMMKEEGKIRKEIDTAIVARSMLSLVVVYVLSTQLVDGNTWNHEAHIEELSQVLLNGIST